MAIFQLTPVNANGDKGKVSTLLGVFTGVQEAVVPKAHEVMRQAVSIEAKFVPLSFFYQISASDKKTLEISKSSKLLDLSGAKLVISDSVDLTHVAGHEDEVSSIKFGGISVVPTYTYSDIFSHKISFDSAPIQIPATASDRPRVTYADREHVVLSYERVGQVTPLLVSLAKSERSFLVPSMSGSDRDTEILYGPSYVFGSSESPSPFFQLAVTSPPRNARRLILPILSLSPSRFGSFWELVGFEDPLVGKAVGMRVLHPVPSLRWPQQGGGAPH